MLSTYWLFFALTIFVLMHKLLMCLKCIVIRSICWKFSVNRVCPMDSFTLYFWHWWYPDYAMPCHLGVVFSVVSKLDRLMLFWEEFIGLVFRVNYRPKGHHPLNYLIIIMMWIITVLYQDACMSLTSIFGTLFVFHCVSFCVYIAFCFSLCVRLLCFQ